MRALSLFAAIAALNVASCTQSDIKANEDKARAILTAVNNGARMAASVVKEGIDAVCANGPSITAGAIVIRTGLAQQSGPTTTKNLDNLDQSLVALNAVCNQAAANPNDPAIKSLLRTAWTAYQSAKASQNQAIATGG